jgi:hypothetical protein
MRPFAPDADVAAAAGLKGETVARFKSSTVRIVEGSIVEKHKDRRCSVGRPVSTVLPFHPPAAPDEH